MTLLPILNIGGKNSQLSQSSAIVSLHISFRAKGLDIDLLHHMESTATKVDSK
jgi:hypothetical protein